jgi:hypothetical protein
MRNYNSHNQDDNQGRSANLPKPRRSREDFVIVVRPSRPASMREAIPGINCPAEGETWQDLAEWRARYGLPPVTQQ